MSQVYATEPQTTGRVILETTHGPLEINLWSRECLSTTKYFLQLCLDGYYNDMLFHRIVPNFLVQTGALRYNPNGNDQNRISSLQESASQPEFQTYRSRVQADAALDRRRFELNSRIRFNHRGQVAMALGVGDEATTGSELEAAVLQTQFFITLDEAPELDGKHVCFGTVTGPTFFNALRIGRTDCDETTYQPTILEEAPRVLRVKILENPIHSNLVPSAIIPWRRGNDNEGKSSQSGAPKAGTKKKRKGVKNINVLSFGDEMLEDDTQGSGGGIKSSHDVLVKKTSSKNAVTSSHDRPMESSAISFNNKEIPESRSKSPQIVNADSNMNDSKKELNSDVGRDPIRNEPGHDTTKQAVTTTPLSSVTNSKGETSATNTSIPIEPSDTDELKVSKPEKGVSLVEARRAKYLKNASRDKRKRQEDTMAKFTAFQSKVHHKAVDASETSNTENDIAARMARRATMTKIEPSGDDSKKDQSIAYHGQILENDNDDDIDGDWMKTRFKCRKHQDHEARLGGDGRSAIDDYEVVDEKDRNVHSRNRGNKHHYPKRR